MCIVQPEAIYQLLEYDEILAASMGKTSYGSKDDSF